MLEIPRNCILHLPLRFPIGMLEYGGWSNRFYFCNRTYIRIVPLNTEKKRLAKVGRGKSITRETMAVK